jgi:type IV secretion system protein VirB11
VLIEDTRELQCTAPNLMSLLTKDGVASLADLVRSSPRRRSRFLARPYHT